MRRIRGPDGESEQCSADNGQVKDDRHSSHPTKHASSSGTKAGTIGVRVEIACLKLRSSRTRLKVVLSSR